MKINLNDATISVIIYQRKREREREREKQIYKIRFENLHFPKYILNFIPDFTLQYLKCHK